MEDKWQSENVIDQLALELKENKELWTMLLERFREADLNNAIAHKIGGNYHFDVARP